MKKISANDVELFLLENPDFFLEKKSLVNELNFHDAPDGVSSILKKQIEHLREEKTKLLDNLMHFLEVASENEDLMIKFNEMVMLVLSCTDQKEIQQIIEHDLAKIFDLDSAMLKIIALNELEDLEGRTELNLKSKKVFHGSFSAEKLKLLFGSNDIQSAVIGSINLGEEVGLLLIGSNRREKYLGDEDTTFFQFLRDAIQAKLDSLS